MKYGVPCVLLLLHFATLNAQEGIFSVGPWHLRNISGELGVEGIFQQRYNRYNDLRDEQKSKYYSGGIQLNTLSYFWDPGIISLAVNGEYNPETRDEKYMVIPDRSEVRTMRKLDLRSTIFADKKITLSGWLNLDRSYFNRENLTNIRAMNRQWGASIGSNNRILPFSIRYFNLEWDQLETESDRTFSMQQQGILARFTKSFGDRNRNELTYSYDDYLYRYVETGISENDVHRLGMINSIFFDENRNYGFRSNIRYYDQAGNYSFNKLDAIEQLTFHLPANVDLEGSYNLFRLEDQRQQILTNRTRAELRHRLFQSLTSEIFAEYSVIDHSQYHETEFKTGAGADYTKKLPFGRLNLGYHYFRHHNTMQSTPGIVHIINEPKTLDDAGSNLLDKPFAEPQTIIITDETGTILYQEGSDYYLLSVNDFIEVVRIPGGRIPEGGNVRISYDAMQPGDSHYEANNHAFHAGLSLFNRLLEIYYRAGMQDFNQVESAEFLTLNRYTQHVVGGKLYYKVITAGMEYDRYNSSLVPYKRFHYFLNLNFKVGQKLLLSANASLRDYTLLGQEINQKYTNISGRASFQLTGFSKINLQAGYLDQQGRNINLTLLTGRAELVINLRKLSLQTGMNFYNREYTNSNFTYSRVYARLARVF